MRSEAQEREGGIGRGGTNSARILIPLTLSTCLSDISTLERKEIVHKLSKLIAFLCRKTNSSIRWNVWAIQDTASPKLT